MFTGTGKHDAIWPKGLGPHVLWVVDCKWTVCVWELHSDEEWVFICRMFVKCASQKKCCQKLCENYSFMSSVMYKNSIQYSGTSPVLDKRKIQNVFQLKRNMGTQMETSPKKYLCQLSKSSAHMARELLKVHSYKITAIQGLFPSNGKNQMPMDFLIWNLCSSCMRYGLYKWECKQQE